LRKLGNAVRRGVDVRLVLQGKSDVAVYPSAVKYYYHHLFAAGIKIYEYHKSVLHAKVATQDGRWCTVGSYNINDLSDILSVELNVEIEDPEVAGNFRHYLLDVIENECEPVNPGEYQNASRFTRFRWRMSYYFLLFMFRITYWLTCKEEDFVE
jgi:cardiolipin synthase